MAHDVETPEGYQKWAIEHHSAVMEALAKDGATITVAPGGFMWFGREDAEVEISAPFIGRYATDRSDNTLMLGEFQLQRVGTAANGNGLYKRVKIEGEG